MVDEAKAEREAEEKEIAVDHHLVEEEEEEEEEDDKGDIEKETQGGTKKELQLTFDSLRVPSPASHSPDRFFLSVFFSKVTFSTSHSPNLL